MAHQRHSAASFSNRNWRTVVFTLFLAGTFLPTILTSKAQAQTFNILHTFTGGGDGGEPFAGLTVDRGGHLYGTTSDGATGHGTVYKMTHFQAGWALTTIYTFQGGSDGETPQARVVFGPDGALYGTTSNGGGNGAGTVFRLTPPASLCKTIQCTWTETVLYRFTGGSDGANPQYGDLAFDAQGNIYGTTSSGGGGCSAYDGCGVLYKLTRSGGQWTESVLYAFVNGNAGQSPYGGVTFDGAGNLYGTTTVGGDYGGGTVYQLTPSGSGWTETTLHSFGSGSDGAGPYNGVAIDQEGSLYGTTFFGGSQGSGIVYQLQPSGGTWTYSVLHNINGQQGAFDTPTLDASGNVYGTTFGGGAGGIGNVFKLTHGAGGWTYTSLHDFHGSDGIEPVGGVALDSSGNIYGTTFYALGEVFEITP